MSTKIGVGIITCNRPDYLKSLLESLVPCREIINELVVVNDGEPIEVLLFKGEYILNKTNLGVGKSKNKALSYLLDKNCDYIFLIEDDTLILDKNVFNKYIEASRLSGIQHFNYGPGTPFNRSQSTHFDLHNRHQLNEDSDPNPRIVIDYGPIKIALYTHIAGMFSFFTKKVLQEVGLIDEQFYNAWDHVDHTYRIIKAGYHPEFWWFADLENSHKLLGEAKNAITKSAIAKETQEWFDAVYKGREIYLQKHGHYPNQPPQVTKEEVIQTLKRLKKQYE
jgi:GT2 family glycosyltransferase